MTSDDLRGLAKHLREVSAEQTQKHFAQAKLLAGTLTREDQIAVKALAGVADCMSRRYRQWADHLDGAANEIDELE